MAITTDDVEQQRADMRPSIVHRRSLIDEKATSDVYIRGLSTKMASLEQSRRRSLTPTLKGDQEAPDLIASVDAAQRQKRFSNSMLLSDAQREDFWTALEGSQQQAGWLGWLGSTDDSTQDASPEEATSRDEEATALAATIPATSFRKAAASAPGTSSFKSRSHRGNSPIPKSKVAGLPKQTGLWSTATPGTVSHRTPKPGEA